MSFIHHTLQSKVEKLNKIGNEKENKKRFVQSWSCRAIGHIAKHFLVINQFINIFLVLVYINFLMYSFISNL